MFAVIIYKVGCATMQTGERLLALALELKTEVSAAVTW